MDSDYIQRQNSNRFSFIRRLYELSGGDSLVSVQLSEIAASIGIQIADADLAAEYLRAEGLIEFTAFGPTISITHAGVVEVENALANPNAPTSSFPPVNIMVIGSVSASQIQQGTEGSSQTGEFHERSASEPEKRLPLSQHPLLLGCLAVAGLIAVAIIGYFAGIRPIQVSAEYTQTAEAAATSRSATATASAPDTPTPSPFPPTPSPNPSVEGRILTPSNGAEVPMRVTVQGTISQMPVGLRAFLCVAPVPAGPIFPQGEIRPVDGHWSVLATYQTVGAQYETFVVLARTQQAASDLADPHFGVSGMNALPDGAERISPIVTFKRR